MIKVIALCAILALGGCSTLTDFAMNAISPDKGGINTEIVVGDKEQVLGNNQDVKAGTIGKFVGTNDNSVSAPAAESVTVTYNSMPIWLTVLGLAGWLLPTPTTMFNYMRKKL